MPPFFAGIPRGSEGRVREILNALPRIESRTSNAVSATSITLVAPAMAFATTVFRMSPVSFSRGKCGVRTTAAPIGAAMYLLTPKISMPDTMPANSAQDVADAGESQHQRGEGRHAEAQLLADEIRKALAGGLPERLLA